ncbi:MAG TPA: zinc ribbon domain-containing protein [Candidatus Binatia bacterium]|nr:zinc ribbon domain-containing protein [Candidatus Binatia bacterium]
MIIWVILASVIAFAALLLSFRDKASTWLLRYPSTAPIGHALRRFKPVSRYAADYTDKERQEFQETFKVLSARHRPYDLAAAAVLLALILFMALRDLIPASWPFWISTVMLVIFCGLLLIIVPLFGLAGSLGCPACTNRVRALEVHCPVCGAVLPEKTRFLVLKCLSCGQQFGRKSRHKIRFCTHCGIQLDPSGSVKNRIQLLRGYD